MAEYILHGFRMLHLEVLTNLVKAVAVSFFGNFSVKMKNVVKEGLLSIF